MNAAPVRFAIVGSGSIATQHARAIALVPGAQLAAVWGRDPVRTRDFAETHGAEAVTDLAALARRDDIHAATIATPSGAHAEAALPFLRAGKAVLCEKPLEVTLQKIDHLLEVATAHGAPLAAILQLRLGAAAQAMKAAVTKGRFGRLTLCSAYIKWWREQSYYDSLAWRGTRLLDGGGALMNQGVHVVDLLQWLVGMPAEISAFSACLAHERIEVEDTLVASLRWPGGALGVIEATTACRPGYPIRIEIAGDRGSAVLEDDRIVSWHFEDSLPGDDAIRDDAGGGVGPALRPQGLGRSVGREKISGTGQDFCRRYLAASSFRQKKRVSQHFLTKFPHFLICVFLEADRLFLA